MPAFSPDRPYNELPTLKHVKADIETREILKLCIDARSALAEFKQAGKRLPDQRVLINTMPLLEAQASSEIENIVTTRDALFRQAIAEENSGGDNETKEALRYRSALRTGFERLELTPLTTNTAIEICRTIKNVDMDIRSLPGTALGNPATKKIIYTPPEGSDRIRTLLNDLFEFLHNRDDLDPLVRMGIGHYQFEAIHPFYDGNGRTGRIINVLYLVDHKLIDLPTLYLSGYINTHRQDYYNLLQGVTRTSDWNAWLIYILTGVRESALKSCEKIDAINQQLKNTEDHIRENRPKLPVADLVQIIFQQPYCRIQNLVDAKLGERQATSKYLRELEKIGIMRSETVGRDKLFINKGFLNLLLNDDNKVEKFNN